VQLYKIRLCANQVPVRVYNVACFLELRTYFCTENTLLSRLLSHRRHRAFYFSYAVDAISERGGANVQDDELDEIVLSSLPHNTAEGLVVMVATAFGDFSI
jgi:hypothetical protein